MQRGYEETDIKHKTYLLEGELSSEEKDRRESYVLISHTETQLLEFATLVQQDFIEQNDLIEVSHLSPQELQGKVRDFLIGFCQRLQKSLPKQDLYRITNHIIAEMIGLGPLEPLLRDPTISDILVNGAFSVFIERKGKLESFPLHFRDEEHLMQIAQRIARSIGRRVDQANPIVDARLKDGSRVNIIIPPLALNGVTISIRKFPKDKINFEQMVAQGNISEEMAKTLEIAVTSRLNILVSGGTGSGKTTLLNSLSTFISPEERTITIEDTAELCLSQPHVVQLEARSSNLEKKGEITIRDLLHSALRMRPDRIVVGEVRGGEAMDMLQAMNTGSDGSMSTIHANTAQAALNRLESLIIMFGFALPLPSIRAQIASAIDLVVHTVRMRDGVRRVTRIMEVVGFEQGEIKVQDLFVFQATGLSPSKEILGRFLPVAQASTSFLNKATLYNLDQHLKRSAPGGNHGTFL